MGLLIKRKKQLDMSKLPYHIGFIIDGNGRWAKHRGLPRTAGHKQGVIKVKETIENCYQLGIKELSFFCFSTENWNRSKTEIDAIFGMLRDFINEDILPYKNKDIKFIVSGNLNALPTDLTSAIKKAVIDTENCKKMIVNFCINYGGRDDILNAVNLLLDEGKKNINFDDFKQKLYSKNMHDIDLVIRTSGEQRISNFMLYQLAYSELYFTKIYWPDFNKKALELALLDYQSRNRRFGAIKE